MDTQVNLSLDKTFYTENDLKKGINVNYTITGTLDESTYVIAFAEHGQNPDVSGTIPFTAKTGSGKFPLGPNSPGWSSVPWSIWPPKNNCYDWDIVLAKDSNGELTPIANVEIKIVGTPVITQVSYTTNLFVQWDTNGGSDFIVTLRDTDGTTMMNYETTENSITIEDDLDATKTYIVSVTAFVDDMPGPTSKDVTAIIVAPEITLMQYILSGDSGKLAVNWAKVGGASGYTIKLSEVGGQIIDSQKTVNNYWTFSNTLDDTKTYQVCVKAESNDSVVTGPDSDPLEPLIKSVTVSSAKYNLTNGHGALNITWDSAGDNVKYIATLYSTDGTEKQNAETTDTNIQIEGLLNQSKTYMLQVAATKNDDVVLGPSCSPIELINLSPEINLLQYSINSGNGSLGLNWNKVSNADNYNVTLSCTDGTVISSQTTNKTNYNFDITLDTSKHYLVKVLGQRSNEIVKGPESEPLQPITQIPVITTIQYDIEDNEGTMTICWNQIAGAEGYIATLFTPDGSTKINQFSSTNNCQIAATLDSTSSYKVEVCVESGGGLVIGPASDIVDPIIKAPDITKVQYNLANGQGSLDINWNQVDSAESYIAVLSLNDGTIVSQQSTSNTYCQFRNTLDGTKTYNVKLQAKKNNGTIVGPFCTPIQPIINIPAFTKIQYSLTNGTGILDTSWNALADADSYTITLYEQGGAIISQQNTAGTNYRFANTLDASKSYEVTIFAKRNNGLVIGPVSSPVVPIITAPVVNGLQYIKNGNQGILGISWISLDGINNYIADLKIIDGTLIEEKDVVGNNCQYTVALDGSKTYQVNVMGQKMNKLIIGPSCNPPLVFNIKMP